MSNLTVLGHIHPDTDTACSAIAAAYILTESGRAAEAVIPGELNKETQFVLSRFSMAVPPKLETLSDDHRVVIVDTNNPEELLPGWEDATIVEIIDHHKLAGLTTKDPILVSMEPVACTCTILHTMAMRLGVTLSPEIAGLMLAAILSDTLKFSSPTTTEQDTAAATALADIAGVSIDDLAERMFAAKSDLSGMTVQDILTVDSKVFNFGGRKIRVSVLETTKPENALAMQEELLTAMQSMKAAEELDGVLFFVVDIMKNSATLLLPSADEEAVAEKAFGETVTEHRMLLPGVVSRKKQMIPKLETAI